MDPAPGVVKVVGLRLIVSSRKQTHLSHLARIIMALILIANEQTSIELNAFLNQFYFLYSILGN